MKRSEWIEVVKCLRANWPNAMLPAESVAKWYADLRDIPAEQVLVAVEALYRDGREFCPNGAQIRAKAIELALDLPEWPAVLRALARACDLPESVAHAGADGELVRVDERAEALQRQPLAIREFVARLGWAQVQSGVFGDGNDEARLREKWTAFCQAARHDLAYRGLPDAGLPRIARANGPRWLGAALAEIGSGS